MPEYRLRVRTRSGDEIFGPWQPYANEDDPFGDLLEFAVEMEVYDEGKFILIDKTVIRYNEIESFGLEEVNGEPVDDLLFTYGRYKILNDDWCLK
jgi:hypothetical protein